MDEINYLKEEIRMDLEMRAKIKFNKPVLSDRISISSGGFTTTMEGKEITFDFSWCDYRVDERDPTILEITGYELDAECGSDVITEEMIRGITCINDFYIYIDDINENLEKICGSKPVCITELSFRDVISHIIINVDLSAIGNAYLENWK